MPGVFGSDQAAFCCSGRASFGAASGFIKGLCSSHVPAPKLVAGLPLRGLGFPAGPLCREAKHAGCRQMPQMWISYNILLGDLELKQSLGFVIGCLALATIFLPAPFLHRPWGQTHCVAPKTHHRDCVGRAAAKTRSPCVLGPEVLQWAYQATVPPLDALFL